MKRATNSKGSRATPTFRHDDPLEGLELPGLANEPPTTLLTVHAAFTVRHVLAEIAYHLDFDNLTKADLVVLRELGTLAQMKLGEPDYATSAKLKEM